MSETRKIPRSYFIEELHIAEEDIPDRYDENDALPEVGYRNQYNRIRYQEVERESLHRSQRAIVEARPVRKKKRPSISYRKQVHPLLYVGAAFFLIVVMTWGIVSAVSAWNDFQDTLHYGPPGNRTFQTDVVVGHGDNTSHPSHFVAANHNHQVTITECPAGNTAKCINYIPAAQIVGPGSEKIVVTLTFQDVNGDGKLDMLVHVHFPNEQVLYYINTGKAFRPATNTDKITVEGN
jgi:hypothetical protein